MFTLTTAESDWLLNVAIRYINEIVVDSNERRLMIAGARIACLAMERREITDTHMIVYAPHSEYITSVKLKDKA